MTEAGTVLVADDHEATLCGLRDLLRRGHYAVWTAANGNDALRIAHDERPDVVLLDVMMPGLSGLDVCAELKRDSAMCLTPVVLISGTQERQVRLAGLEAGADDFLSKPVDMEELYARMRSLVRLKRVTDDLECAESLFLTLGRIIEARDPYTEGHCERLARYATALGAALDLPQPDIDALYRGAFLHDIGKIAIPDAVLLKKSKLTPGEYELMKRHPVTGDELCRTVRSLEPVRQIVRHHHERLDGSGYPDGLIGDQIPLLAQIVAVVDVFDALTTDRPYRRALSPTNAYETLRAEAYGGWYSVNLVERFIALHRRGLVPGTYAADLRAGQSVS
jgi:putative two-component system response regulator